MAGPYDDYDWDELPAEAKKAAEVLGYNKQLWDSEGKPASDSKDWAELTKEEQAAAQVLGYNQKKWDSS